MRRDGNCRIGGSGGEGQTNVGSKNTGLKWHCWLILPVSQKEFRKKKDGFGKNDRDVLVCSLENRRINPVANVRNPQNKKSDRKLSAWSRGR